MCMYRIGTCCAGIKAIVYQRRRARKGEQGEGARFILFLLSCWFSSFYFEASKARVFYLCCFSLRRFPFPSVVCFVPSRWILFLRKLYWRGDVFLSLSRATAGTTVLLKVRGNQERNDEPFLLLHHALSATP